jgi:hypothetical protein
MTTWIGTQSGPAQGMVGESQPGVSLFIVEKDNSERGSVLCSLSQHSIRLNLVATEEAPHWSPLSSSRTLVPARIDH